MTPMEAVIRREQRIEALLDRIEEGGPLLSQADFQRLDQLNLLDLMAVSQGAIRQTLEMEHEMDGVTDDTFTTTD